MDPNPGFQVSLDVKGRPCLILGGDDEAADKAQRLLDAGAKVTVVSPTLNDRLRKLTAAAKILHRGRAFRSTDAQGVVLVINTLRGDPEFTRSLYELAQQERFVLCSVDNLQDSTGMLPATVARGHLRIAISTSGVAPALASRLRQNLEPVFDDRFHAFLDWLADLRKDTQLGEADAARRRAILCDAVEGFRLQASLDYPQAWIERDAGARA